MYLAYQRASRHYKRSVWDDFTFCIFYMFCILFTFLLVRVALVLISNLGESAAGGHVVDNTA